MTLPKTLEAMPSQKEINKKLEKSKPKEKAKPEAEKKTEQQIVDEIKKPGAVKTFLARLGVKKYYEQIDKLIDQGWRKGPEGWEKDPSLDKPEPIKETTEAIETAAQEEKVEAAEAIKDSQTTLEKIAKNLEITDEKILKDSSAELLLLEDQLASNWQKFQAEKTGGKTPTEKTSADKLGEDWQKFLAEKKAAEKSTKDYEESPEDSQQILEDQLTKNWKEFSQAKKRDEKTIKSFITGTQKLETSQTELYDALWENPSLKNEKEFSTQTQEIIQQLYDIRQQAETTDPKDKQKMNELKKAKKKIQKNIDTIDRQINKQLLMEGTQRLVKQQKELLEELKNNPDLRGIKILKSQTKELIKQLQQLNKQAQNIPTISDQKLKKINQTKKNIQKEIQAVDKAINKQLESAEKRKQEAA